MFLGRILGTVEASVVCDGLTGVPLLWVQPEKSDGTSFGAAMVAADSTSRAGDGDRVYLVDGREAAFPLPVAFVPVDATVIGIVDEVVCL